MELNSKIYITGSSGLIGSALYRLLKKQGYRNLITSSRNARKEVYPVDLRIWNHVDWWFSCEQPEYVFHCAARVGGVQANRNDPLGFFRDNMSIEMNVLEAANQYGVKKLMFLGSSCIYPKDAPKPLKESSLLTGSFQPEVEAYGLAKVAGVKLCQWYRQERHLDFISVLPCNIFGENDNIDPCSSHVVPGILCKMHEAVTRTKTPIHIWGDGSATRELLFADDLAEALLLVMQKYSEAEPINTGSGVEYSIANLAELCRQVVGYPWELRFDPGAVVGASHKCMDNSKLYALGWKPKTPIIDALRETYADISRRLDNREKN